MYRVNVHEQGSTRTVGWFNWDKATRWSDADHDGNGSGGTGRGQALIRTAEGKWVLESWTHHQGEANRYHYATPATARDWLISNHEDEAVERFFGALAEEEDRRPGRPAIGEPVNVRLGDLLPRVDAHAYEAGVSRAEAIRDLVAAGLDASPVTPSGADRRG